MLYLKEIWSTLHERLQIHFNHVLLRLQTMLLEATTIIDDLIKSKKGQGSDTDPLKANASIASIMKKEGRLRRGAFALSQKDSLDKAVKELRQWHQDMFDPSWFQLLRVHPHTEGKMLQPKSGNIEVVSKLQTLQSTIKSTETQSPETLEQVLVQQKILASVRRTIIFSPAELSVEVRTKLNVVVDTVQLLPGMDAASTLEDVCRLAKTLSAIDPESINLLPCRGVIKKSQSPDHAACFEFLFWVPTVLDSPRSLRELLLEGNIFYPLDWRLDLAKQLAKSVMFVHSLHIVHKNIRPETILVFHSKEGASDKAFLVGFEKFRPIDKVSLLHGDVLWERAIYRHPTRQGLRPEKEYVMQHDIYSLGVCLLEMGLWQSFVINPGGHSSPHPDIKPGHGPQKEALWRKAYQTKDKMVALAKERLPGKMGKKYTEVTISCLSCLDPGNVDFGDEEEFEDKEEILVGVRFMEMVSAVLNI